MKQSFPWKWGLLPLAVHFACTAVAQESAPESDGAPDSDRIEEVIVTGVARGISKQDATFSVNTLDAEQIKQLAPISTADLLQNVPGLFAEGSSAGEASNNITVRGLPVTGGYRYAPQLIDGLPWFEEAEVQFMNNDSAARIDLMTKTVEVVKGGTGGILYSNGLGATVNHVSRRGGQDFKGELRVELADYNFIRTEGYVSGPINDNLTFAAGGYYRQSDGIRDTGFQADHGGQLKGNLLYLSDNDKTEIFAQYLMVDDHTAFYQNVPFQVPAFSETGTPENPIEIDKVWELGVAFEDGTVVSPSNRNFTQLGEYGSRDIDMEDGLHADFDIFTLTLRQDLNDTFTLYGGARYTEGSNDFNAMFTGNDSANAVRFNNARWENDVVGPAFGAYSRGDTNDAKLNGFFATPEQAGLSRDEFVDAYALGTGVEAFYLDDGTRVTDQTIVNYLLPFIARTDAESMSVDVRLQTRFDFVGNHELTIGAYASDYSTDQSFQSSLLVSSMEAESRLADLYVVDAEGSKIGPSLTLGGSIQPGFFGYTSMIEAEGQALYVLDHWELMNDRLKLDIGVRWQSVEADVSRLDRNITANSNFTPAGVIPGSPDDLTTADDAVLLPDPASLRSATNEFDDWGWSIGANYAITNDFAVYGLVSDLFRLPSLEDFNEFRVSDQADEEQIERIMQYEAGLRYYADTWDTQIALFANEFTPREDSVQYRDFTSSTCVVNDGIADLNTCPLVTETFRRGVENRGIEIEFAWRPDFSLTKGLELRMNGVMQDPEIVDANYTVVNTVVENDVVVGYEFLEVGEDGRVPRRLSKDMFNFQAVWDLKPMLGVPLKPYMKYTYFSERFSESRDVDVTLYPEFFHIDGGVIWDISQDFALQFHVSNITNELSFTEGDPLIPSLKGPNGATNRGVGRPLFGRIVRAMLNYRF